MGLISSWRAMRWVKWFSGLVLLSLVSLAGPASAPADGTVSSTPPSAERPENFFKGLFNHLETEFILTAGLRRDSFDWSISGNGTNVLSELTWSSVDSYQLHLANRSWYKRHLYLRGHLNYAWIKDGRLRDSDYGASNRAAEYSRSISETNDDELWDVSIGGGYAFYFLDDRFTVAPMIGFSYNKQNFRIQNGQQVISQDNPYSTDPADNPPPAGPLSDALNSTYFARWMGPWIGCDLRYRLKDRPDGPPPTAFGLSIELHWADYYGEGNWNLRSDLEHPKSFEHNTAGYGLRLAGDTKIQVSDRWAITLMVTYCHWTSSGGTNRVFSVDEGTLETDLNEVNRSATSMMMGAVYRF